MRLDIERIEAAVGIIDPVFKNSPQYVCESLSRELGCLIVLKVETMNPIRCFKGRGTETVLSVCRRRMAVTVSSVRAPAILVRHSPTAAGGAGIR